MFDGLVIAVASLLRDCNTRRPSTSDSIGVILERQGHTASFYASPARSVALRSCETGHGSTAFRAFDYCFGNLGGYNAMQLRQDAGRFFFGQIWDLRRAQVAGCIIIYIQWMHACHML